MIRGFIVDTTIDFKSINEKLANVKIKKSVLFSQLKQKEESLKNDISLSEGFSYLQAVDIEKCKSEYSDYQNTLSRLANNKEAKRLKDVEFNKYSKELLLASKSFDFFSNTIDEVVQKYLKSLEEILNVAYFEIYQNETKSIKLDIVEKYNKKVLQLIVLNNGEEEKLNESGGGVKVVLGVILLIYYILWLDLPKIIFFDETFSCLDSTTLDNFFSVLYKFNEKDFKFVIVSHDDRLLKYIDNVFIFEKGALK
jgi:ABC-type lipoprotein export system ATPase subunit